MWLFIVAVCVAVAVGMQFWKRGSAADAVRLGQHTAFVRSGGKPFVVFLIGARLNSWGALWTHFGAIKQLGMGDDFSVDCTSIGTSIALNPLADLSQA